jgi:hypothetical protein
MAKTLQFRRGTTSELVAITPAAGEILIDTTLNTIKIGNDTVQGGKIITGLSGSSYIYVTGNGASDTANGEELAAAYALAKTMTPYGSYPQDPDNRVKVIIAPGKYYVGGGTAFPNNRWDIDAHCVDIVSLTGNRDVWITGNINIAGPNLGSVIIRGLDVSYYNIYVASGLQFLTMENCRAYNFAAEDVDNLGINLSGTFIDCESQNIGFGSQSGSNASGTFINCKAYDGFGNYDGDATGVFTNCTTFGRGFAYSDNNIGYGIASGTFTNCTAGWTNSFGGGQGGEASGVFTNCVGGNGSFAGYQSGPGTFSGTIEGKLYYCRLTDGEFAPTSGNGKLHYCIDGNGKEVTSGGGLGGTSYVFVAGDQSSSVANGQQLINAYTLAKTLTPYAQLPWFSNRVRVVVAPGNYDIQSNFTLDTDYVDVVSLTGNRDVSIFTTNSSTFNVTANQVIVKGLNLSTMTFGVADNLSDAVFENCFGGDQSFGGDNSSVDGTFINCEAINNSFGGKYSTVYGTFINCEASSDSFGGTGSQISGTFTDCTSTGLYSFGGPSDLVAVGGPYITNVSGTFTNCKAYSDAFGANPSVVTGVFTNCSSQYINSFGGGGSAIYGTFNNCDGGVNGNSFGGIEGNINGARFINCKSGNTSFGSTGSEITNSTFTNCVTESYSFGFEDATIDSSSTFTNCIAGDYSFGGGGVNPGNAGGTYFNCVAGTNSFGGGEDGIASGTFNNCVAKTGSFGQVGDLTGKAYYCTTTGTFPIVSSGGKTFYCVDSSGPNNQ